MNLESLISKYLDGELTPEEDSKLRDMLNDPDAKEMFEGALELHLAFKEDADGIETPKDVLVNTEDIVLMKILSEPPVIRDRKVYSNKMQVFASLTIAFLFLMLFRIDDMSINYTGFYTENSNTNINELPVNSNESLAVITEDIENESIAGISSEPEMQIASGQAGGRPSHSLITNSDNIVESTDEDRSDLLAEAETNDETDVNNSEFSMRDSEPDRLSDPGSPESENYSDTNAEFVVTDKSAMNMLEMRNMKHKSQADIIPKNSLDDFGSFMPTYNSEVQLSSFLGTDVLRSGIKNNDDFIVSHFSQSIAYALDNNNRMGLEIGLTHYSYAENVVVDLPAGSVKKSDDMIEVIGGSYSNGDYIPSDLSFSRDKKLLWGAAFYEASIFNSNGFTLNGRIGAGGSADGPMGYSRLFAKYELLGGISLTLGGDARLFYANLQALNGEKKDFKSAASLIYGIQFKF